MSPHKPNLQHTLPRNNNRVGEKVSMKLRGEISQSVFPSAILSPNPMANLFVSSTQWKLKKFYKWVSGLAGEWVGCAQVRWLVLKLPAEQAHCFSLRGYILGVVRYAESQVNPWCWCCVYPIGPSHSSQVRHRIARNLFTAYAPNLSLWPLHLEHGSEETGHFKQFTSALHWYFQF